MPIAFDIGFRPRAPQRSGDTREIARFLFRAARILFEALFQRAQTFKLNQPGNGRGKIGQRLYILAKEAQRALPGAIIRQAEIVELAKAAAERFGHHRATPGIRRRVTIEHGFTKINHPWTNGQSLPSGLTRQVEPMNRTIKSLPRT